MRKFVNRGIAIGLILSIANFCFQYIDVDALLLALIFFALLGFIFLEFISIFTMWRKYKYISFIPFAISIFFIPLLIFSGSVGRKIGMYNTPSYPDKYFNEERRKELTEIAEELLQAQDENSQQAIKEKLYRHHRLAVHNVDYYSNIVELYYYRSRRGYAYIFAKDGLPEKYSTEPVITEDDIHSWAELANMAKTGNDQSKYCEGKVVFVPGIVYPFLIEKLDKAFVAELTSMESYHDYAKKHEIDPILDGTGRKWGRYLNFIASKISNAEKAKIVEILNEQCRITSGLIENSNISFEPPELWFCKCRKLFDWPVDRHLRKLISDGVISVKDNEGHLQVKSNLSDKEIREVEWLQVEIMNRVYGNLVEKTEYWSNNKTRLTDNWYFYRR